MYSKTLAAALTTAQRSAMELLARGSLTVGEAARVHDVLDALVRRDLADYDVHGVYLTPKGRAALAAAK